MKLINIVELISSLRHAEIALCEGIKAVEDHAGARDPEQLEYPIEARLMHRRLENIRATIDRLETELPQRKAETKKYVRVPTIATGSDVKLAPGREPKVSG